VKAYGLILLLMAACGWANPAARPKILGVSHIALYAADPAKTERFYVHDLGATRGEDPEQPSGVRYYFSSEQFVEVLPLPAHASVNRLDHVAFRTADAVALLAFLKQQGIEARSALESAPNGERRFMVADPEGNLVQFIDSKGVPSTVARNALSGHIIHVGFIIHDRAREDDFFRRVLGFRPYWQGGMRDDQTSWVSQQVPDGTDWLEYMIVGPAGGRGIPADMRPGDVGILNHFSLGVANIEAAYTLLWNGARLDGQDAIPKIGRDAKWQLNLLDPDGTRAEIMELHAIGTPCCSPFTAADPRE
jgi:catechol 2,3-dioxygenase-like lactoylglutathione lyase family enzyme